MDTYKYSTNKYWTGRYSPPGGADARIHQDPRLEAKANAGEGSVSVSVGTRPSYTDAILLLSAIFRIFFFSHWILQGFLPGRTKCGS